MKNRSVNILLSVLALCMFLVAGLLFYVLRGTLSTSLNQQELINNQYKVQEKPDFKNDTEPLDPKKFETETVSAQIAKIGQNGFSYATFKDLNTIKAIAYQDDGGLQKINLEVEKLNTIDRKPLQILRLKGIDPQNQSFALTEQQKDLIALDGEHIVKKNQERNFEIYGIDDEKLVATIPSDIKVVDPSNKDEYYLQYYREQLSSTAFNLKSNVAAVQTVDEIKIYDLQNAQLKSTLNITKLPPSKVLEKLVADKTQEGFAFAYAFVGGFDTKMAFSSDGSKLAVMRQELDLESLYTSFDDLKTAVEVEIYDLKSGAVETIYNKTTTKKPQTDVDKLTKGIIKFDQNGDNLVLSLPQRNVAVYNFASKNLKEFIGPQTLITALAIDKDANILASGDAEGYLNIWDINSGKLVNSLKAHKDNIVALEFAQDSNSLLSLGGYDQKLSLWGRKQDQKPSQNIVNPLFTIQTSDVQNPNIFTDDLVFSKDGKKIYTTNYQEEVQMWDMETQKKIWSQKNSENEVIGLSNDELRLIVVGPNQEAVVLNTANGEILNKKEVCVGQHARVISMNPIKDSFVINCEVGLIEYDIDTLEQINIITLGARRGFGFSKDGKYFISDGDFDSDNIMEIYDNNFKLIKDIYEIDYNSNGLVDDTFLIADSIEFSPDNTTIAAYSPREFLSLFDFNTYQKKVNLVLPDSTTYLNSIAFHPDEIHLVTAERNGGIKIWNIRSGSIMQSLSYPGEIKKVLFRPDGSRLIVAGESGLIKVYEVNL